MRSIIFLLALLVLAGCERTQAEPGIVGGEAPASREGAVHYEAHEAEWRLANMQRLTHGGANAEAYFSADGSQLIFQATRPGESECDQIYTMDLDGRNVRMVSTGAGRTTCGYFFPAGDRILFSSTHHVDETCPAPPDRSRGYVWPLHPYDVFIASPDGSDLRKLTDNPAYDGEATISPDGESIVFTSHRDGDVNIFVMDADGGNVRQLTHEPGYAGGPFFSADGSRIVYRAHHPTDPAELEEYFELLGQGLVRPERVELYVMDADGSNRRQVTSNGAANFAPFFHPDGERIIFSSNMDDPSGRAFDLYLINIDGTGLERVTFNPGFDSFPMFSRDGSRLVFASDRGAGGPGEFNVFVAEWVDGSPGELP
jgi:TolB protein